MIGTPPYPDQFEEACAREDAECASDCTAPTRGDCIRDGRACLDRGEAAYRAFHQTAGADGYRYKALDLFCCAGGAGMGLYGAGFDVTGVDIAPQPLYPFPFVQADAMTFDLGGFDFIWASPPCQRYSLCQRVQDNEHPDLIPLLRERLKASGKPYVIENVPGAPLIDPVELCGGMFGLRTYRHRLFECSFPVSQPFHGRHEAATTKMGRPPKAGEFMHVVGNFSNAAAGRAALGAFWMTRDKLREAIPPAYSRYIGDCFVDNQRLGFPAQRDSDGK